MCNKWNMLLILIVLTAILSLSNSVAVAQGPLINITIDSSGITWQAQGNNDAVHLTVIGPDGFHLDEQYAGNTARFNASSGPDGTYNYELVTIPHIDEQVRAAMASVTEENRSAVEQQLRDAGKLVDPVIQSGAFYVIGGAIVDSDGDQIDPDKDIQHLDDVIITFSLCVGTDCVNGENFGFDTIRFKENNLRIHFDDTSNSGSFPSNDWRIIANDSANGGGNYLAIEDSTAGRQIFRVDAGAPANSLRVDSGGDVGIGTSNPVVETHIVDGDSPTIRLEQNGSSGFTAQTWDLAGNEANFFIRDVTNGSKLPFKIKPNAPNNSIFIASNGDLGIGTDSPQRKVHVIGPDGKVATFPSSLGGKDAFVFENNGNVNMALISGSTSGSALKFYRDGTAGFVGYINYNHNQATMDFLVENSSSIMTLAANGNLSLSGALSQNSDVNAKVNISPVDGQEVLVSLAEIPISTWSYKNDSSGAQHMGPMAQDFYEAFELGQDNLHIAPLDTGGAALAAIQALYDLTLEKDAQITQLQEQNVELEARLEALEQLVETLAQK